MSRLAFDEVPGGQGAQLFVTGDEKRDAVQSAQLLFDLLQRVHCDEHATLHVVGTGPTNDSAADGERHVVNGAHGPHGVVVTNEHDAPGAVSKPPHQVREAVDDFHVRGFAHQALA